MLFVAEVQPTWGAIADRPEDRSGGDRAHPGVDLLPAAVFTTAAGNRKLISAIGDASVAEGEPRFRAGYLPNLALLETRA
jgi:hypothetical protein